MTDKGWALMSYLYIGTRAEPKAVSVMRDRYSKARLMSLARIRAASLHEDVYVTDEHGAEIYCAEYVTPSWHGADMGPIVKTGF